MPVDLNSFIDLNEVARAMVKKVEVRTAYGPPIVLEDPFAPGPPNPYLQQLKPEVVMTLHTGTPVRIAPYGRPGPTKWPLLQTAFAVTGAVTGGLFIWWALHKLNR